MFILLEQRGYNGRANLTFTLFKCTFSNFQLGLSIPQDSKKFHLQALNATGKTSSGKEKTRFL